MSCKKCSSLCKNAITPCMKGVGPKHAKLMIIGEAPGAEEDAEGVPFIGKAGRFLRKNELQALKINEAKVFITNAVRCRPPKNKTPTRIELLNCRPNLEKEIKRVQPKVIVLLGNAPLCSVLYLDKVQGITKWRGKALWSREFNCWIVPTFHPSALMRDFGEGTHYRFERSLKDFELAISLIKNNIKPKLTNIPEIKLLREPEEINIFLKKALRSEGPVSVDSETASLDTRNEILGISMSFKLEKRYYASYILWDGLDIKGAKRVQRILDTKLLAFHHIGFDEKVFHYHGLRVGENAVCTMIASHLIDENFPCGLKERTWRHLNFGGYDRGLEQYKYEHKFTKRSSYKTIPVEIMAPYAAIDAFATLKLWEIYERILKKLGLWNLFMKISMPARRVFTQAEIAGFAVDIRRANEIDGLCNQAKKVLEKRIYKAGGKEFNINSTHELGRILFDRLKLPVIAMTKTGRYKVDKKVLEKISTKKNKRGALIAKSLLKFKYIGKLQGTYIGQAKRFVWKDGRVHSSYNLIGTVTGRPSNNNPCTNNIPKDRMIRSLYTAAPGCKLVEADLQQAEMRVLGAESRDKKLLKIFENNENVHAMTFKEVFGKSDDYELTQEDKRVAKAINFGVVYGITSEGLRKRLGIDKDEAQEFIDKYLKRFKGVDNWIRSTIEFAHKHGYVKNIFGRRRRLPDINSDNFMEAMRAERQAQNSPIQGGCSDYAYLGLIRLKKLLDKNNLKSKIIHSVYDCGIVEAPNSEVKIVKRLFREAFEKKIKILPVQMRVDLEVTKRWGEKNESALEKLLDSILDQE